MVVVVGAGLWVGRLARRGGVRDRLFGTSAPLWRVGSKLQCAAYLRWVVAGTGDGDRLRRLNRSNRSVSSNLVGQQRAPFRSPVGIAGRRRRQN